MRRVRMLHAAKAQDQCRKGEQTTLAHPRMYFWMCVVCSAVQQPQSQATLLQERIIMTMAREDEMRGGSDGFRLDGENLRIFEDRGNSVRALG